MLVSLSRNPVLEEHSSHGRAGLAASPYGRAASYGGGGGADGQGNGTAEGGAVEGGRTLEDIVRTVASDYENAVVRSTTQLLPSGKHNPLLFPCVRIEHANAAFPATTPAQRFAYYFEEDLPFLGQALGVEFPSPGQPLFLRESRGGKAGVRHFYPHPVKCASRLCSASCH